MAQEWVDDGRARPSSRIGSGERVQIEDVLQRLALSDSWDLCSEAKVEKCRATRDLRSCGRNVQHLLATCGHACLCVECSQRCDICPVCRTPITRTEPVLKLRLYDECLQAGLVREEDFREGESAYSTLDAWRLCSFFDVAVENNLTSAICHYVTDVCMDDTAVSSDPVISMLLDGAVVKDWCKTTFMSIIRSLREIYESKAPIGKADILDRHHTRLRGICDVLETLEAPLDSSSPTCYELNRLADAVRMVMQHLEVMTWCIRQRFLENVPCCYTSIAEWKSAFQDRKHAALYRAWPDYTPITGRRGPKPHATLFIEDALVNIRSDSEDVATNEFLEPLRRGSSSLAGRTCYPLTVAATVDLLFLEGTPDHFLAKKATFLYYLYDRHWKVPETDQEPLWERVIEDYVNTFAIPRQSMLESFIFYLLDNNSDLALEKACRILPEIASLNLHPKISRVLLERDRADVAHSVLRSSGRFRLSDVAVPLPLGEAVTATRVWTKCGLLMEAYKYQQRHCNGLKADKKHRQSEDDLMQPRDWQEEMDVLVGELCLLCIEQNSVKRMLELPWRQADEEAVVKKCLYEHAVQDPCSTSGSLLVVFYLQRCRFLEAFAMHQKLQQAEDEFVRSCQDQERTIHLQSMLERRVRLLDKCLEQLPEVVREQLEQGEVDSMTDDMQQDEDTTPEAFQAGKAFEDAFSPAPANLLVNSKKKVHWGDSLYNGHSNFAAAATPPSAGTGFTTGFTARTTGTATGFTTGTATGFAPRTVSPLPPSKSPLLNGFSAAAPNSPLFSPLLGKRLRYEKSSELSSTFTAAADGASGKQDLVVTCKRRRR